MINKTVSSRYKVTEKIGEGGMATVYKALDENLGRVVALKVLLPQYANDPTFAARFRQEAQAAANLSSPFIVNIYDWGFDQDSSTYFIVMEYVRGIDLKSAILQKSSVGASAIKSKKVAEIAAQICSALSVAHGYDVIHRDIKPQNIMIQPDGNIKVMDFGIARAGNSNMTQTGSVLGTANYVSPEQAQGKPLTGASDIYSLGVLMYETATGELPFKANEPVAVALKQVNETPVPPSQINPEIDPVFEAIILKAMAKDPNERFTSADQMRVTLNKYIAGRLTDLNSDATTVLAAGMANGGQTTVLPSDLTAGTSVMPSVSNGGGAYKPASVGGVSGGRANGTGGNNEEKKSKKGLIAALIVLGAVVIGVVLWLLLSNGGDISVPDLVGQDRTKAEQLLEEAGLKLGTVTEEKSDDVEEGKIISQDPAAGTKTNNGGQVNIVISAGKNAVTVPNVINMSSADATRVIEEVGLKVEWGKDVYDENIVPGNVAKQNPAGGKAAKVGDTVTLNRSLGNEMMEIPDVTGDSETAAKNALQNAGFEVKVNYEASDSVKKGTVISQNPGAGGKANKGTTVTIVVSDGPELADVPNLVGKTSAAAESALKKVGLSVNKSNEYSDTVPAGKVISQSPGAGVSVTKGSSVSIVISLGPNPSPNP